MLFFHEAEFCSRNIWNFRRKKKKFLPQVLRFALFLLARKTLFARFSRRVSFFASRKPTRISFASLRFFPKSISMLFRLADNLEFFVKKVPQELLFPRNTMRILDFSFLQFLRFLAQKFIKMLLSLGTFSVISGKVSITQIVLFVFTSKTRFIIS